MRSTVERRAMRMLSVAFVVASGCSSTAPTRIVVSVTADPEVISATDAVRLRVLGGEGDETTFFDEPRPLDEITWPIETTIVPRDGDATRAFRVEVVAEGEAGQSLAIVRAATGFVVAETRVLALHLRASCLGVLTCGDLQTCDRGHCVDAYVDPASLAALGDDAGTEGPVPLDAGSPHRDSGVAPRDGGVAPRDGGTDACTPIVSYADVDGDGYGDPATQATSCARETGRALRADDCDDNCRTCRPDGIEICDGERDEDCDGTADEGCACVTGAARGCPAGTDAGECVAGSQTCIEGTWGPCSGRVDPVPEDCDALDDDCDGRTDEGLRRDCGTAVGACTRGTETCESGTWGSCTARAPAAETCNGIDDDCDARTDERVTTVFYRDGDGDGFGNASTTTSACAAAGGWVAVAGDCNDTCRLCRPGGTETCDGALDENCAMGVDEGCACTTGSARACPAGVDTGECVAGTQSCVAGAWAACAGVVGPVIETCNGRDDDCDGRVDEALLQACGPTTEVGICRRGSRSCSAGAWGACMGAVNPALETCNGMDDDCDGVVDDGATTTFFVDADMDTYGVATSTMQLCVRPAGYATRAGDCDDARPTVHPGATETCDGSDQDCDALIDDGLMCTPDAGPLDAGPRDAGPADAGRPDSGPADAGAADAP